MTALEIPAARYVPEGNLPLALALGEARAYGVPAYSVAAAAGIAASTLSMIQRGRLRPSEQVAAAIAAALGRDMAELFPGH